MEIPPLLLGHRGARGEKSIPENTIASFDFALASGCDGFEFDVRLTGDGKAVLSHNAAHSGQEIEKCSAGKLCLPLLREILTRYRKKAFLDIELKVPGLEKIIVDLLRTLPPKRGFVVSSFLPEVLGKIHSLNASTPLGLICETRAQLQPWRKLPVAYVIPHYTLLEADTFSEIKAAGKKILVWTVNAALAIRRFSKLGVDGIISDNPQSLARALKPPKI